MNEKLLTLREKANQLPLLPGVYIMMDSTGKIIYIGKAKKLKNRVSSYFRGEHLPKVAAMVEKVNDFNVIIASSEFEALVLENSLIKRHRPHYNILLKDDKGYPFIKLNVKNPYPSFTLANHVSQDGSKYFGPFAARAKSKDIIRVLSKAIGLPTCSKSFPRDIGKERPCLQYQIGVCRGWCRGEPGKDQYLSAIHEAELVLEGKSAELVRSLTEEMEKASEDWRFEEAALLRDRIRAIEGLENRQKVLAASKADTDAIGFQRGERCCFAVLHYKNGDLVEKDYSLIMDPFESDEEALSELLRQYYSGRAFYPRHILVPCDLEDVAEMEQWLSDTAKHKVSVERPQRGDRYSFLQKAQLNAREEILRSANTKERENRILEWFQEALQLPNLPKRIEAYDISNTGNCGIVASMTVHINGHPAKSEYRKFQIKETTQQNDYASMNEVIRRRFQRYLDHDPKFSDMPDVLFIDGGEEHASAAEKALSYLNLSVPVVGMVKDDHHRTRALVTSTGKEIGIQGNPAIFSFVGNIQEETHRFAIGYHRSLRDAVKGSSLDKIPGVGPARRQALLHKFKTVKAISEAGIEELSSEVPYNVAYSIFNYYHAKEPVNNNESNYRHGEGQETS